MLTCCVCPVSSPLQDPVYYTVHLWTGRHHLRHEEAGSIQYHVAMEVGTERGRPKPGTPLHWEGFARLPLSHSVPREVPIFSFLSGVGSWEVLILLHPEKLTGSASPQHMGSWDW